MVLSAPLPILIFRVLRGVPSATSQFAGLGLGALPGALVFAFLQTGLSEEILFRGFLLKRLAVRFGFGAGNMVQSVIFGAIHGLGFFTSVGWFWALLITLFTGISAWFMGYINEKKADGSIFAQLDYAWGVKCPVLADEYGLFLERRPFNGVDVVNGNYNTAFQC